MRPILLTVMALATLVTACQAPGPTAFGTSVRDTSLDEAEIVRILTEPGRSKHSSPDLDWENAFGVRRRGLTEVVKFWDERVYPTMSQAKDTTHEIRVNFVTADVAVADQYWSLTGQTDGAGGPTVADRAGRDTYVFRREGGRWVLVVSRIADLRKQLAIPH